MEENLFREKIDKAIQAIEDFNHSTQLPFPDKVKEMMIREEFPLLVKQLRAIYNERYEQKPAKRDRNKTSFAFGRRL